MVGPVSNSGPPLQRLEADYGDAAGLARFAALRRRDHAGEASEADSLADFCVLVRREALELADGPSKEASQGDAGDCLSRRLRRPASICWWPATSSPTTVTARRRWQSPRLRTSLRVLGWRPGYPCA